MSNSNTIQGILNVKKSWFRPFNSLSFKIQDMPENKIEIVFDNYNEAISRTDEVKNAIIDYIKTDSKSEITRKELVGKFKNRFNESAIRKALEVMEKDSYIEGEGNTKNRIYKVIPLD